MKRITFTLIVALFGIAAIAQTPDLISYQAVVRDASNMLVASQSVGVQVSVLETTAAGTAVYVETHTVTTNANGLATFQIGGGTVVSGVFADIEWGGDDHFLKVETDPTGGTNYTISGTSQLLRVPYALSARSVETLPAPVYYESGSLNSASYNLTSTYIPVGPTVSITKQSDDSVIEAYMNSRVSGGVFTGANGVLLELRVDGVAGDVGNRGSVRVSGSSEFQSLFSAFEGLSAGSHTVQVYAKTNSGTSAGFLLDSGGWGGKIIVKETY